MSAGRYRSALRRSVGALLALMLAAPGASGAEALVAVAANFSRVAADLEVAFEATATHRVTLVSGATGKFYAQIVHGAPFDVFLAADARHPALLAEKGFAVAGSRFTYAVGRLGLWVPGSQAISDPARQLRHLKRIAMANPALAPYGAAARSVLTTLGLDAGVERRLAMGENVAQAFAMVAAGAADGGLVAWSHIVAGGVQAESLLIPAGWHAPIRQEAILLTHGESNPAARAFLDHLRTDAARAIIRGRGYPSP